MSINAKQASYFTNYCNSLVLRRGLLSKYSSSAFDISSQCAAVSRESRQNYTDAVPLLNESHYTPIIMTMYFKLTDVQFYVQQHYTWRPRKSIRKLPPSWILHNVPWGGKSRARERLMMPKRGVFDVFYPLIFRTLGLIKSGRSWWHPSDWLVEPRWSRMS